MIDETPRGAGVADRRVRVGCGSWALFHAPLRVTHWTAGVATESDTGQQSGDGDSDDGHGGSNAGTNTEEHETPNAAADTNHSELRVRGGSDGLPAGNGDGDEYTTTDTHSATCTRAVRHTGKQRVATTTVHGGSG